MKNFKKFKGKLSLLLILAIVLQLAGPSMVDPVFANTGLEEVQGEAEVVDEIQEEDGEVGSGGLELDVDILEENDTTKSRDEEDVEDVAEEVIQEDEKNTKDENKEGLKDKVQPFADITDYNFVTDFEFTYTDEYGNPTIVEDGQHIEVDLDTMNAVNLKYTLVKPNDTTVAEGDTYIIDLPGIFKDAGAPNQNITIDGTVVGSYEIVDNRIVITFSSEIENFDDAEMYLDISGEFNKEIFETEEEVEVKVPYKDGTSYEVTIEAKRKEYSGTDKKTAGKQYVLDGDDKVFVTKNPEFIDWAVRVNDSMGSFNKATVIDDLDNNLEIDTDSFKVERIIRNYKNEEIGREIIEVEPKITENGFELELGDIKDTYEITYTTRIIRPDGGGNLTINNNARIILDEDENEVNDSFEGSWSGDIPAIEKNGSLSSDPHIIDWEVKYNFGKEDLGTVTLTDKLTHGKVIENTIKVYQVEVDIDGNILDGTKKEVEVTPSIDGDTFTIPDLDADGKAYFITFSSTVPVGINDSVTNKVFDNLEPKNSDDASVNVNTIPSGRKVGEQKVDSEGRPYIEWTITMNSTKIDVPSITVQDVFNSEYLNFDVKDSSLYELYKDGSKVEKNFTIEDYTHSDGRTGFRLEITEAGPHEYKFVYRTYYTEAGMKEEKLANEAELVFLDGDGEGIGEPIGVEYDLEGPKAGINKSGHYVLNEETGNQEIEWTVTFNKSKILLNAGSTLTDNFTSDNYTYIAGSIGMTAEDGSELVLGTDYTFEAKDENKGFVITLKKPTKSTITVKFKTTVDDDDNKAQTNEASLKWQGGEEPANATVEKRDPGMNKSGSVEINEDGSKTVNWTINFNTNRNVIYGFELTDTNLPSTVTISKIKIMSGEEDLTDEFEISEPNEGVFTVKINKLDAKLYTLTYSTSLSATEEAEGVKNTAKIKYKGGDDSKEATILKPMLGVQKEAVSIKKGEKTNLINWKIIANTDTKNHLVNLVNPVLTDTIPSDQRLVKESIVVTRADNKSTVTIPGGDITREDNSFEIKLPNGPYQYIITFQTEILEYPSVNEKLDRYTNETKLSNDGYHDVEDKAYIDYFADGTNNNNTKNGVVNDDTENIDWEATVNPLGLTIKNAEITDTLSNNQTYVIDENNKILVKAGDTELIKEIDYTLEMVGEGGKYTGFIITFTSEEGQINKPITISYSTRLNPELIGTYELSNNIKLTGGESSKELSNVKQFTTNSQWSYGGGGSGKTLEFTLNKSNPSGEAIPNAKFKLSRVTASGDEVFVDNIETGEEGQFKIENARAGRYIITETAVPEGYEKLKEPIYMIIGYASSASGDYIIKITDLNWEEIDSDFAKAEGNQLWIVNEHKPVSLALKAEKKLEGKDLQADQFAFQLKDENGVLLQTEKNDSEGQIIFQEIEFDTKGVYEYTISEVDDNQGGITYDSTIFTVKVTVTEDENGNLIPSPVYSSEEIVEEVVFHNAYSARATEVNLTAAKTLNGQSLVADQFTFELLEEDEVIQTVKNDSSGTVTFETITYEKVGDYSYKIREVSGNQGGITYDSKVYEVVVRVTDNGEGQLIATAVYVDGPAEFTNIYTPEADSIVLEASKTLEGQELKEGQFTFSLLDSEGNTLQTKENNSQGQIIFDEISYKEVGEYKYFIKEVVGSQGGMSYDETLYEVIVSVTDDGGGQLEAVAIYVNGPAEFTNIYTPATDSIVLEASKILEGQELKEGQFTFSLLDSEGNTLQTKKNNLQGQIIFDEITYEAAGEYEYFIEEVAGSQNGISYDKTVHQVIVSVTDDGVGQLNAVATYARGSAVFTNTYTPAADSLVLEASKTLEGQELKEGQFTFVLLDSDGNILQRKENNSQGQIIFDEITYEAIGEYTYTIAELEGSQGGITYDNKVYEVIVTVTDDGGGQLEAVANYVDGPAEFTNIYTPEADSIVLEASKILEGQDLKEGQFTFVLLDSDGNILQRKENNSQGQIIFDEITYDFVGEYTYTIAEIEGSQGGISYDEARYEVIVRVTDDGEGQLEAKADYVDGEVVFTNTYTPVADGIVLEASKTLKGQELKEGQFTFVLLDAEGNILQTKNNNSQGQIIFDEITYQTGGEFRYTIREVSDSQRGIIYDDRIYEVLVIVEDDGEGTLTARAEYIDGPVVFENTYEDPTEPTDPTDPTDPADPDDVGGGNKDKEKVDKLPKTGESSKVPFYIGGGLLMAVGFFLRKRRRA